MFRGKSVRRHIENSNDVYTSIRCRYNTELEERLFHLFIWRVESPSFVGLVLKNQMYEEVENEISKNTKPRSI